LASGGLPGGLPGFALLAMALGDVFVVAGANCEAVVAGAEGPTEMAP
jgi:hypothetical protein